MQADGAQHCEGGMVVRHSVGNAGAQVLRHAHHLGVLAVRYDAVADRESLHPGAKPRHHSHVAIAQGQRLVELALHRLQRGGQAVGAHLLQHHAHLVRLLACLVQPVGLAELDQHAFGAYRHQRPAGSDKYLRALDGGAWNLGDFGGASFKTLKNLFHF